MRVAVAGWFGSDNLGDELLLSTTISLLREIDPRIEVVAVAADPERVMAQHHVSAMSIHSAGGIDRLAGAFCARRFRGCDVVLLGPGTVFQERSPWSDWPGTLPALGRVASAARTAGSRLAVFGAAVREGGTLAGTTFLRGIAHMSAEVAIRDPRSAAVMATSRTRVIGDVAAAWPQRPAGPAGTRDSFGVSLRHLPAYAMAPMMEIVRGLVKHLHWRGLEGVTLPFGLGRGVPAEDDRTVLRADPMLADLPMLEPPTHAGTGLAAGLESWSNELAACRVVIATRLHAAIIALRLGVPVVAIPYEHKVVTTMHQLGLSELVVHPRQSVDAAIAKVDAALDRPDLLATAQSRLDDWADTARVAVRNSIGFEAR